MHTRWSDGIVQRRKLTDTNESGQRYRSSWRKEGMEAQGQGGNGDKRRGRRKDIRESNFDYFTLVFLSTQAVTDQVDYCEMGLGLFLLGVCFAHEATTKFIVAFVGIPKCGTRTISNMLQTLGLKPISLHIRGTAFFSAFDVNVPSSLNFGTWKYTFKTVPPKGLIHATLPEIVEKWRLLTTVMENYTLVTSAVFREPTQRVISELLYRNWAFNLRKGGEWTQWPAKEVLTWVWGWGGDYESIVHRFAEMSWEDIVRTFAQEPMPAHTSQARFLTGVDDLCNKDAEGAVKLVLGAIERIDVVGTIENVAEFCEALYLTVRADLAITLQKCADVAAVNVNPNHDNPFLRADLPALVKLTWLDRAVYSRAQQRAEIFANSRIRCQIND
jgi:hypothetical protein